MSRRRRAGPECPGLSVWRDFGGCSARSCGAMSKVAARCFRRHIPGGGGHAAGALPPAAAQLLEIGGKDHFGLVPSPPAWQGATRRRRQARPARGQQKLLRVLPPQESSDRVEARYCVAGCEDRRVSPSCSCTAVEGQAARVAELGCGEILHRRRHTMVSITSRNAVVLRKLAEAEPLRPTAGDWPGRPLNATQPARATAPIRRELLAHLRNKVAHGLAEGQRIEPDFTPASWPLVTGVAIDLQVPAPEMLFRSIRDCDSDRAEKPPCPRTKDDPQPWPFYGLIA